MRANTIPQTPREVNRSQLHAQIMKNLIDFHSEAGYRLVEHLMNEKNYSNSKIGNILGLSRQRVGMKYGHLRNKGGSK